MESGKFSVGLVSSGIREGPLPLLMVYGKGALIPLQLATVLRGEGYIPRVTYFHIEIFIYTIMCRDLFKIINR